MSVIRKQTLKILPAVFAFIISLQTSYGCAHAVIPASFVPHGCLGDNISIPNESYADNGKKVTSTWYYGDGNSSTDFTGSVKYAKAGIYTVTLIAADSLGCTDTATIDITVLERPHPEFSVSAIDAYVGDTLYFTNLTKDPDKANLKYTWKYSLFGTTPMGEDTGLNASEVFSYRGLYQVTLIASREWCSASYVFCCFINVDTGSMKARFSNFQACAPYAVDLRNRSSISQKLPRPYKYFWDFGDGITSTAKDPSIHVYSESKEYIVKLRIEDAGGKKDSTIQKVTPLRLITPRFFATDGCENTPVQFSDSSLLLDNWDTAHYTWHFGDGAIDTGKTPTHKFASAGTYTVKLVINTKRGCKDSISKSITVYPSPNLSLSKVRLSNRTVKFSVSDSSFAKYLWYFGDGDTSWRKNPTHTYKADGSYDIKLLVESGHGCISMLTDTVQFTSGIQPNPDYSITLFPNPFKKEFTLQYTLNAPAQVEILVTDLAGHKIIQEIESSTSGVQHKTVSGKVDQLKPGCYILSFNTNGTTVWRSILIKQ